VGALTEPVVVIFCVLHRVGSAPFATSKLIEIFTGICAPIHGLQQRESWEELERNYICLEKQWEKQRRVKSKRKEKRNMEKKERHTYIETEINDTGK